MTDRVSDVGGCVMTIIAAMRILTQLDLKSAIQDSQTALDIGPIFHPTLWRDKHQKLSEDVELMRAALPLWKYAEKLRYEKPEEVKP